SFSMHHSDRSHGWHPPRNRGSPSLEQGPAGRSWNFGSQLDDGRHYTSAGSLSERRGSELIVGWRKAEEGLDPPGQCTSLQGPFEGVAFNSFVSNKLTCDIEITTYLPDTGSVAR